MGNYVAILIHKLPFLAQIQPLVCMCGTPNRDSYHVTLELAVTRIPRLAEIFELRSRMAK